MSGFKLPSTICCCCWWCCCFVFVLFCFVLFCFVLFCFVFCFVLFCFVLFCFCFIFIDDDVVDVVLVLPIIFRMQKTMLSLKAEAKQYNRYRKEIRHQVLPYILYFLDPIRNTSDNITLGQWCSQGFPGWASRLPGGPKWDQKWEKFEEK